MKPQISRLVLPFFAVLLNLAWGGLEPVWAENTPLTVAVTIPKPSFCEGEPLTIRYVLQNTSKTTIHLVHGKDNAVRLRLLVKDAYNKIVSQDDRFDAKRDSILMAYDLLPGQTVERTLYANMTPSVKVLGSYTVQIDLQSTYTDEISTAENVVSLSKSLPIKITKYDAIRLKAVAKKLQGILLTGKPADQQEAAKTLSSRRQLSLIGEAQ